MLGVPYLPANCRHVTMCGRTKGCLRRQSCSHQWHAPMSCRVRRLLHSPNAVATVSDAHFRAGLPFLSIQGTLNHLLASDALWWMRFTGQKAIPGVAVRNDLEPSVAVAPWLLLLCTSWCRGCRYWNGPAQEWASLTDGVETCEKRIRAVAGMWRDTVDALSEEELHSSFGYSNTRGDDMTQERAPILSHVFNHSTHHRGQLSGAIARHTNNDYPVMDLLYYLAADA